MKRKDSQSIDAVYKLSLENNEIRSKSKYKN